MPESTFYNAAPRPAVREHFIVRTPRSAGRLAAVLFGLGFLTVFVAQASFIYQVVLGAPIFEEFFKFGLALLLVCGVGLKGERRGFAEVGAYAGAAAIGAGIGLLLPGPWEIGLVGGAAVMVALTGIGRATVAATGHGSVAAALATVPVALAVGAGFGILEHAFSYSDEGTVERIGRGAFHAFSTGASMAAFQALWTASDLRARWFSTALSTGVHYVNNVMAVIIGIAVISGAEGAEPVGLLIAGTLIVVAGVGVPVALAAPGSIRRLGVALARKAMPAAGPAGPTPP